MPGVIRHAAYAKDDLALLDAAFFPSFFLPRLAMASACWSKM